MAGNFKPPPREKNALDNRKLNLSTPCPTPGGKGKYSALIWGLYANNPRITVYTNDPDDTANERTNGGKISANLDLPVFFIFLDCLRQAIEAPGEFVCPKIENKGYTFFGGKKSDSPVVLSELLVGKDKEGIVWMSIIDKINKERPKIKFPFQVPSFHQFAHRDNTPLTPAETSVMAAKAYLTILEQMMVHVAANNYVEPPPKDNARGGGGGRGGGSGGGGGNWGNRGGGGGGRSDFDRGGDSDSGDDLPF